VQVVVDEFGIDREPAELVTVAKDWRTLSVA
jgi:hypothetical protein